MDHKDIIPLLRKIEGQVRGVQRMVDKGEYCVDILTQLNAVVGAIENVEDSVLKKHFENCVLSAFRSESKKEREKKMGEILCLISKFRR